MLLVLLAADSITLPTWGVLASIATIIAGFFAIKQFNKGKDEEIARKENRLNSIEKDVEELKKKTEVRTNYSDRLTTLETKVDSYDKRFDASEKIQKEILEGLNQIKGKLDIK